MTPLRQRMIEDLQLRGYSDSTQTLYVSAVRQLCEHFSKTPGKITEEDLRNYFLYGKNVKKWSRSTSTVALCGIKFFYENTIKRPWPTLLFIRPGREKKLPVVLSRDEVREILSNIQLLRYSGLSDHNLLLWSTLVGRHTPESRKYRRASRIYPSPKIQGPHGRQRPQRAPATKNLAAIAPAMEKPQK